jgi:hypothetical protein
MSEPAEIPGPRRRPILPTLLLLLVALVVGMGAMAWLFYRFDSVSEVVKPSTAPIVNAPPAPRRVPLVNIAPPPDAGVVQSIVDDRIGRIESKVDAIDARTAAASSEAHRAERLLVAFAARRAVDRGASLGYLEGMLRDRFGRDEPQAVATVISASRQPVTIVQLRDRLDALRPQLSTADEGEGWWDGMRRELANLIVVRKVETPSTAPIDRFARAREELAAGRVDGALVEVARLPGRTAAATWIAEARRYVQARTALDRIESAALLEEVVQAPPAAPVAAAEPATTQQK